MEQATNEVTLFDLAPIDLKGKIKQILIENFAARDNDAYLLSIVWRDEIKNRYGNTNVNVGTFLNDFSNNFFTHFETIRRYRQRIQQEDPTLNGNKRDKRITHGFEISKRVIQNNL